MSKLRAESIPTIGCVLLLVGLLLVPGAFAWLWWGGWWKPRAMATSPDGKIVAVSRIWYRWAPMYGWNYYYISLRPSRPFRSVSADG